MTTSAEARNAYETFIAPARFTNSLAGRFIGGVNFCVARPVGRGFGSGGTGQCGLVRAFANGVAGFIAAG